MSDDFEHQMNGPEIDDYDATFKNEQFTVLSDSLTYLVGWCVSVCVCEKVSISIFFCSMTGRTDFFSLGWLVMKTDTHTHSDSFETYRGSSHS